jgi:two-component system CheB/CheR fusion protein
MRLLLIDDNPHDRELLARTLRQRFASVTIEAVRDQAEFERAMTLGRFDAVVVDYQLGWSNGIDVFRKVRQSWEHCPVLMFTASGSEEVAVEAMKEGLDDYITKTAKHYARLPFALEAALERGEQRRSLELAESERVALRQEVHLGQLHLQLALKGAGMVAWAHDPGTGQIRVSANAAEVVGVQWHTFSDVLNSVHSEDLAVFREACARCCENRELFACTVRVLDRHRDPEQELWMEFRGQPLRDATGTLTHVMGVAMDVTAQVCAEEELRAADRRKDTFVATLAHELRNPLAPIRYATRLLEPDVPPHVAADARKVINSQLRHMARLLDDLLDVSRVTRGTLEIRRDLVDLNEAIDIAVQAARPLAESAQLTLSLELPTHPLLVCGDAVRLSQVIGNLLNNAIKFTNAGGHIQLMATVEGAEVVVRVLDDGIGVAAEVLPTIFDLFVQGQPRGAGATEGLGIGLSLARDVIKLHRGNIHAHSAGVGLGSEFVVRLPRSPEGLAVTGPPASAQPVAVPGASSGTVLVVDDNVDAADTLSWVLKLAGFHTSVAHDANAALEIVERVRPDVALLDIGLPDISGHELARRLRGLPCGRTMHLIAISGWGQENDHRKSLESGFDEHLTKPVDPERLMQLMSRHKGRAG